MGFRYIPASAGPETYGVLGGLRGISGAAGGGSINYDFTTGVLPGAITFTRASIGTYVNNAGTLTTASNDVARFNYVAGVSNLLIEGSATNLALQSNNFLTTWTATNSGVVTASQFVSPDGTNNGWSVTCGTGNAGITQAGVPFTAGQYTASVWAKAIVANPNIRFLAGAGQATDLTPSAILARLSNQVTCLTGTNSFQVANIAPSGTNGLYGAQLESGTKLTSYIPTTTAPVTRAADSATFTVPAGINQLKYTFDDNSTQTVSVSPGSYTIPTTLSRANIKSIVGSYGFDFTSGSLPADITFTRASIGTYNSSGNILTTASSNVARFNYVAGVANLLIEAAATNILNSSNSFSDAGTWLFVAGAVATPAQFVSPDGSNNGWSLTSGTGNGGIAGYPPTPITASTVYTVSIWVKRITGTPPVVFALDNVAGSGNIATSSTITRLSDTITSGTGGNAAALNLVATSGNTIGIYGAQLETGSRMTSYIPTTTAAVTRAADSAVFTVPSGVGHLTYTFDDNSTQLVTVSAGSYTIPVTLNRPNIKSIVGSA